MKVDKPMVYNTYEADVSTFDPGDWPELLPDGVDDKLAGYKLILDAEHQLVAIAPHGKAERLVAILNWADRNAPHREDE